MCIAIPMEILELDVQNNCGIATFSGNKIVVNTSLVCPKIGDYVLVHAGCAIEIIRSETAEEIANLYRELEDISR